MQTPKGMQESILVYHHAFDYRMLAWKKEVLFTWEWWLGVCLAIIPWIIWLFIRKKESTHRLLYAGIFVSLVSVSLDNVGVQLSGWNYLKPVTPAIPSYLPFDFTLMPISVMLFIQLFHNKNPWIIGIIFGLIAAFIGEPIFKWLKIYELIKWKYYYSFPIYIVIYFIAYKLASSDQSMDL